MYYISMLSRSYEAVLSFLRSYERPLATVLFISGFVGDLLTFGFLDLPAVTLLFAAYLGFVLVATVIAHGTYGKQGALSRPLSVLAPLLAQFTFGSILSGFLIFYAKSAVLSISWPFIILIGLVFFGNELFRNYREQLIFQTILVYFSLYAFAIFALPLYLDRLGTGIFLGSTALALAAFMLYVLVLAWVDRRRLANALAGIIGSIALITAAVVGSYLAGLLPPIPLTLKDGGIYQEITHTGAAYVVEGEPARAWWDPRPQIVHHLPGTPLYAYSAVFAPGGFTAGVVHVWQEYDEETDSWITKSTVAFTLSGGRSGGYRGYSLKGDPEPGEWRVLVQTASGQTIGAFRFNVVNVTQEPVLKSEAL